MSVQAAHFPTEMYFRWSIVIIFLKRQICAGFHTTSLATVKNVVPFSPLLIYRLHRRSASLPLSLQSIDFSFSPHMCEKNMAAPSTDVQLVSTKKPTGKLKTGFVILPSPLQPFYLIEHLVELQYLASDDNVS